MLFRSQSKALGFNLFYEYAVAFTAGDVVKLQHWFYLRLFNCDLSGLCDLGMEADDVMKANQKNGIALVLICYIVFLLVWMKQGLRRWIRIGGWALIILAALLVVLSVSRSAIITLMLVGMMLIASAYSFSCRTEVRVSVLIFLGGFVLSGVVVFTVVEAFASGVIGSRLADLADDPRWVMYHNAFEAIGARPFLGHGIGKEVADARGVENAVHNIFLGAWLQTGVLGLTLAVAWWFSLLRAWITVYLEGAPSANRDLWIAATVLPIVPLANVLQAGGGTFYLNDFFILGVFLGLATVIPVRPMARTKRFASGVVERTSSSCRAGRNPVLRGPNADYRAQQSRSGTTFP